MRRAPNRTASRHARLDAEMLGEVAERSSGGIPMTKEIVVTFIDDLRKSVDSLRAAVQQHDIVTLVRVSHYLHGAAVFVDAPAMAQLCSALGIAGSSADYEQADELVTALEIESAWLWAELNDRSSECA